MELRNILLLGLMAGAMAIPLNVRVPEDSDSCAQQCTSESSNFKYVVGNTYTYTYETDTLTKIEGASEEHSSLHLQATAEIAVISECDLVLNLKDVTLKDSQPNNYQSRREVARNAEFKRELEANPLRFAFQDGRIEEVCPVAREKTWVLNIKRGLISAFQTDTAIRDGQADVTETDVSGTCAAEYKVLRRNINSITMSKTKDLMSCTDRHGHHSSFQATPYRVDSKYQSAPLLKGFYECEQTLHNDGYLQTATCTERNVFRPFSKNLNGAMTKTEQKLTFVRNRYGTNNAPAVTFRSDLLFEHRVDEEEIARDRQAAMTKLQELCTVATNDVRPETARLFSELVMKMKSLDDVTLRDMYDRSERICKKARSYMNDVLPMIGTTSSVKVMSDLMTRKVVSDIQSQVWLTSIAFTPSPTAGMLVALKSLVDTPNPTRKSLLAVSTIVHGFCRTRQGCGEERAVRDLVQVFTRHLGRDCTSTPRNYDTILMSLKALGNTGYAESATNVLNACFNKKTNPMEIRVSAVQALRRTSCEADRSQILALLKSTNEDPELRIAAYLATIECPNPDTIDEIKKVLETEEVNQVGSFIWTHLTNLMETSDIHKQDLRHILEDEVLKKEFNLDQRKFSRNYEWSAFSEMLNTGAKVESNVIMSHKSFIPRAGMLNLTIDMFGHSVNLFEVGGRLEGMEYLLESFFGPNSKTSQPETRGRDPHATFDGQFAEPKNADPSGSIYLKIFGNEIRYMDLKDMTFDQLKEKLNPLDLLIKLSQEHNIEVTKNLMFMNSNQVVPTISGLPLKLAVDGVMSVNVRVKGKMDIRNPKNIDINGEIAPSAVVEVSTAMCVDAVLAKAGMKMTSSVHSSTATNALIKIKDGKIINLALKFPKDKMEVFGIKTAFYVEHRAVLREQKMIREDRYEVTKCISGSTGVYMEKILGLAVCAELQYPNASRLENAPYFPVTGPVSLKLDVLPRDLPNGYIFELKFETQKVMQEGKPQTTQVARLAFNTPGSKVNRDFAFDFSMVKAKRAVNFSMKTPWKTVGLSGSLTTTPELKRLETSLELDGEREYALVAEIQTDIKAQKTTYTPSLTITMPGSGDISMAGSGQITKKGSMLANINLRNVFREPFVFKGKIDKVGNPRRFKYVISNTELRSQWLNSKISGFVDKGPIISSRIELEYQLTDKPKHKFVLNHKTKKWSTKTLRKYVTNSAIVSTQFPNLNLELKADFLKNPRICEMNVDFGYGSNYKIKKSRMTVSSSFSNKSKKNVLVYDYKLNVKYPLHKINFGVTGNHQWDGSKMKTTAAANMLPFWQKKPYPKKIDIGINYEKQKGQLLKVTGDVTMKVPGHSFRLSHSLDEQTKNTLWRDETFIQYNDKEVKAIGTYKRGPKHTVTATVELPELPKTEVKATFVPNLKNFEGTLETKHGSRKYGLEAAYNFAPKKSDGKGKLDINGKIYTAEGSYKYSPLSSEAHGKVSLEGDLYTSDVAYTLTHSSAAGSGKGNLKFTMPGTVIISDFDVKRDGYDISGKFDLKHNSERQSLVYVEADLKNTATNNPSLKTVLRVKRDFVEVNADYTYSKNSNGPQLEGNFRLNNNYMRNYPQISFKGKHNSQRSMYKTNGEFDMGSGRKYEADLQVKMTNWKEMDNTLIISTPIANYQRQVYKQSHKITNREITGSISAQARGQKIELGIGAKNNGRANKCDVEASVTFTSPFRHFEDMSLIVKHSDDSVTYTSNVKAKWAPRKEIDATFTTKHERNGYYITNGGKVEVKTPFRDFENLDFTWNHQNTDSIFKTRGTMKWNRQQITLDVDNSYRRRQLDSKIRLTTPFEPVENIYFEMSHFLSDRTLRNAIELSYRPGKKVVLKSQYNLGNTLSQSNGEIDFEWDTTKFTTNVNLNGLERSIGKLSFTTPYLYRKLETSMEFNLNTLNNMNAKFEVKTPIRNYEQIAGDFSWVVEGKTYRPKMDFSWARNRKVGVEGAVTVNGLDLVTGNLRLTTPFEGYERTKLTVNHQKRGSTWKSSGELEFEPGKKVEVNGELTLGEDFKGSFSLKTPWLYMQSMSLSVEKSGSGSFNFKTAFGHDYYRGKTRGDLSVDYNMRKRESTVNFNLESPLPGYERISYQTVTSYLNNRYTGSMTLTYPGQKITRSEEFFYDSWRNFGGKWETTWGRGQKMSLEGKFAHGAVTKGELKFASPFEGFENLGFKFGNEGTWRRFSNSAEVVYGSKKATLETEFLFDHNMQLRIDFKSPSKRHVDDFGIMFNKRGQWENFGTRTVLSYGRQKIEIDMNSNMRTKTWTATVKTPFRRFEETKLKVNHNGNLKSFENHAEIVYYKGKIELDTQFTFNNNNNLRVSMNFKSPYEQIRQINAKYTHNGNLRRFNCHAEVEYQPRKKIVAELEFKNQRQVEGKLEVKTPFDGYEQMSAAFNHRGDWKNFNNHAEVQYQRGKKLQLDTEFNIEDKLSGKMTFKSPFYQYEEMLVAFNHEGPWSDFKNHGEVQYQTGKKIQLDTIFKFARTRLNGGLTLKTPFRNYETVTFNFNHDGNYKAFRSGATITYPPRRNIAASVSWRLDIPGKSLDTTVTFTSPYRNLENIVFKANHAGALTDFKTSSSLEYSGQKIGGEAAYKLAGEYYSPSRTVTGALKLQSPFRQLRNLDAKVELAKDSAKHSGKIDITHNFRKMLDMDATYAKAGTEHKASLQMRTPRHMNNVATLDIKDNEVSSGLLINWNVDEPDSNIRVNFVAKDPSNRYRKRREVSLQVINPHRTVAAKAELESSNDKWLQAAELSWGPKKVLGYEVTYNDRSRGVLKKHELDLKLKTPIRTLQSTMDFQDNRHKLEGNMILRWDAVRSPDKKMIISADYQIRGTNNQASLLIKHPSFAKDVKMTVGWMFNRKNLKKDFTLEFANQKLTNTFYLVDESVNDNQLNYTLVWSFNYPRANIDVGVDAYLAKKGKVYSTNTRVKYVNSRRKVQISNLYGMVNLFRNEFILEARNPVKNIKMQGDMAISAIKTQISLVNTYDDRNVVKSEIVLNKRQRKFDMKVHYSPENKKNILHVYGRYLNPRSIKMEAYRVHNNKRTTEGRVLINLNKNHILHSDISWRPQIFNELKNKIASTMGEINRRMISVNSAWSNEVRNKQTQIKYSLAPMAENMEELMNTIDEDIDAAKTSMNDMYYNDEFYVKTIHQYSNQAMENMKENMRPMVQQARSKYSELVTRYRHNMDNLNRKYNFHYHRLSNQLQEHRANMENYLRNIDYQEYMNTMMRHTRGMADKVKAHPYYKKLVDLSKQATAKLTSYSDQDVMAPFRDMRTKVKTALTDRYNTYSRLTNDRLNKILDQALRYELAQHAKDYADRAKQQAIWAWNYWKVEESVTGFFRELYQDVMTSVKDKSKGFMDYYLQLDKNKLIKFQPSKGDIEFQIYVPARIQGLDKFPRFPIEKYISKLKALASKMAPATEWLMWDTIYKYKPSSDYKNWVPPFKTHATIAGRQHFMTFDKKFYEFAGDCSYVLARDFIDGNFTVLVNYDGDRKKSLTVASNGKIIEIFPDFRVTVDRKNVELPLEFGNTTIVRDNHKVVVASSLGLKVSCDMVYDVCQVHTSGWYFGKVGGLMGTYDNEPSNDFMTSQRGIERDVEGFTRTWDMRQHSCRKRNTARQVRPDVRSPIYALCAEYFKENSSPFRPCFRQLAPEPFMQMCLNTMERTDESKVCQPAAFYVQECQELGVPMRMPKQCVKCSGVDGEFFEGDNYVINKDNLPQTADTVLVVEEKPCNERIAPKLNNVVRDMERALMAKGLRNNRFGLVGFGGEGVMNNEHSRTIDGEIMNTHDKLGAAISSLRFSGEGSNNDALRAVRFATLYPFRTGVAKNIVLIKCSTCHENTVSYPEIQQLLLERGITLHVLMEHQFTAKTKTPKTSYIFGADSLAAYTHKDATQTPIGDTEIVRQLSMPKDICVALAQQTNGSVFNSLKLVEARVRYERYFMEVFGKRIAKTTMPHGCQRCECVADKLGHGLSVCKRCDVPTPFQVLPHESSEEVSDESIENEMNAAVAAMGDMEEDFETYFR